MSVDKFIGKLRRRLPSLSFSQLSSIKSENNKNEIDKSMVMKEIESKHNIP